MKDCIYSKTCPYEGYSWCNKKCCVQYSPLNSFIGNVVGRQCPKCGTWYYKSIFEQYLDIHTIEKQKMCLDCYIEENKKWNGNIF